MKKIYSANFSFELTEDNNVNKILQAVVDAGKKYYNTDCWSDEEGKGDSCAKKIEEAAKNCELEHKKVISKLIIEIDTREKLQAVLRRVKSENETLLTRLNRKVELER